MAQDAVARAKLDATELDILQNLIKNEDFPEVFERLVEPAGGMKALCDEISASFSPGSGFGDAYRFITKWPIRCYLTTNYEDEIARHLDEVGVHFTTLLNSQADFAQVIASTQNRIVKIHGDLTTPEDIVLTTSQYSEFSSGGARQYFRSKLTSILQMVPVLVVGHSMADRDLQFILELAKESASATNPIFMIVADADRGQSEKLLKQYNIRIISYSNADGDHRNLAKLLRQIDRFVVPRSGSRRVPLDFPDSRESETAVSLYVHSSLGFGGHEGMLQRAIQPQVLSVVVSEPSGIEIGEIPSHLLPVEIQKLSTFDAELQASVNELVSMQQVVEDKGIVEATDSGRAELAIMQGKRSSDEDQFYGALEKRLRRCKDSDDVQVLIQGFKKAIVEVFRKRGLATAEMLFKGNSFEPADMPELFESVFPPAAEVEDFDLRTEYCNAIMDILTDPNEDQQRYLAHLSQGFFAFHMFGLDPTGQEIRKKIAQDTLWILDSNILMPILAKQSSQHEFMVSLVNKLKELGIRFITTPKIAKEIHIAWNWMQQQLRNVPNGGERVALLQTIQSDSYTENPFVDGFINGAVVADWRGLDEYRLSIGFNPTSGFIDALERLGVAIVEVDAVDPSVDSNEIQLLSDEIYSKREDAGTLRAGATQTTAEAEVIYLIRHLRTEKTFRGEAVSEAFFVSTSRLLDHMYQKTDGLITWYPDSLHNHLSYLHGGAIDPEAAFDAITTSFYAAGVSVVDKGVYQRYFAPAVSEASATLGKEIDNYAAAVSSTVAEVQQDKERVQSQFARLPELEKPMFVEQLGWEAARRNEQRANAAEAAKQESDRLRKIEIENIKNQYDRKGSERARHEAGRQKNLSNPKHQRKLERQKKKRKKKR
ncbi:SIR2 family NAD-dependent protein deacylase [Rhodopirellula islandica]|nr:SIR2 family protein [Rhodopirellula islandica]